MFQVVELKSLAEIEPYESVWNDLHERSPDRQFTRSCDWFKWNVQHSNGRLQPHVLIAYVMNRAIGVVPMVIQKRRTSMGMLRVLSYLSATPFASSGQVGPNSAATLAGAMKHLRRDRRRWDLLDLRAVDYESEDHHRTPNAMKNAGMTYHEKPWEPVVIIDADEIALPLRERPSMELLGHTLSCSDSIPIDSHELLHDGEDNIDWIPFAERAGDLSVFTLRDRGAFVAAVIGVRSGSTMTFPVWLSNSPMNWLLHDAFRTRVLEEVFGKNVTRCVISAREFSRGLPNKQVCQTRRYTVFSGKSLRGWVLSAHQTGKRLLRGNTRLPRSGMRGVNADGHSKEVALANVVERLSEGNEIADDSTQPMPRLQIYRDQSANSA